MVRRGRKWLIVVVLVGFLRPAQSEDAARSASDYQPAPYKKLCSAAFVDDYAGKKISFRAMFVGEWTIVQTYEHAGIKVADRVFLNHRDVAYKAADTGLGSSDAMFPEFALSIPKSKSDVVYELQRGDIIEVRGRPEASDGIGKKSMHVFIDEVTKAAP